MSKRFEDLENADAQRFLTALSFHFGVMARAFYTEAGTDESEAVRCLRTANEIHIDLAKQLLRLGRPQPSDVGYPEAVFMEILREKASNDSVRIALGWAIGEAWKAVENGSHDGPEGESLTPG